jgi:hypothetical protein
MQNVRKRPFQLIEHIRPIILLSSYLWGQLMCAQTDPPHPMFRPPLDIPIEVAGNFMELRTNHFHSGLDMKTEGRIGLAVKAAADGWVSRIKISPWGYGKAVYVDHPSGYTTVYGHLSRLNGPAAAACLDAQYKARDFSIDRYYAKGELPVAEGETIAFSGNTGGSTAPHLHFEVRRTSDQHALDPQAYGMHPVDDVPPKISGIRIEPLDSSSRVSPYMPGAVGLPVIAVNDSTYMLKPGTNIAASGIVGVSVNVTDHYSNSSNTCGIRYLTVSVDGGMVFSAHLDEIDFSTQRYANAYMDYGLFEDHGMHYNRCYKLPNNKLAVYGEEAAEGRIAVMTGKDHAVQVVATDAAGNRSKLTFVLHGAGPTEASTWPSPEPNGVPFLYARSNTLVEKGLRFSLPPNALYRDTRIRYRMSSPPAKAYAPLHRVQDEFTPLQLAGEITLDLTREAPAGMTSKLLVVRMDHGRPSALGGTYANGQVTARVRTFGDFTVMLDTVPPTLVPLDLRQDMRERRGFRIKVGDNLSGLDQWTATIDGQWVLLEYNPKDRTLEHTFDMYSDRPGDHILKVEVADERGNRTSITRNFTR